MKLFEIIRNYFLVKKYPFLKPSMGYSCDMHTHRKDYKYHYEETWLDCLPPGWRKAFGLKLCKELKEIIDKYAQKDDDGNLVFSEDGQQILILDGKVDECNDALEELQNLEVQVETYNLQIDDLGEDIECTPEELEALMPFIG